MSPEAPTVEFRYSSDDVLTPAQTRAYLRIMKRLKTSDGTLRYGDVAQNRTDERVLSALVDSGEVLKTGFATYALPESNPDAQLAQRFKAKLTCLSAAKYAGLRILTSPSSTHLALPLDRGLQLPSDLIQSTVLHRERKEWLKPNVTSAERSSRVGNPMFSKLIAPWPAVFARIALCQPLQDAVVALDSGLAADLFTKNQVLKLLQNSKHAQPIRAVRLASGSSQSVLESLARIELVMAGFKVKPQFHIDGVGYVDLLVEEKIVVELDGFSYHGDRKEFRNDRARDRLLTQKGFYILRFAYEDVINSPEVVVQDVRRLLATR